MLRARIEFVDAEKRIRGNVQITSIVNASMGGSNKMLASVLRVTGCIESPDSISETYQLKRVSEIIIYDIAQKCA